MTILLYHIKWGCQFRVFETNRPKQYEFTSDAFPYKFLKKSYALALAEWDKSYILIGCKSESDHNKIYQSFVNSIKIKAEKQLREMFAKGVDVSDFCKVENGAIVHNINKISPPTP